MSQSPTTFRNLNSANISESIRSVEEQAQPRIQFHNSYNSDQIAHNHRPHHLNLQHVEQENLMNRQTRQAFSKNKTAQADKLRELKKQYQILKNMHVEQSMMSSGHHSSSLNNSHHSVESDSMSSHQGSAIHEQTHSRLVPITQIQEHERKQLEIMLTNSMTKIEELLRAEVQYKKKIHQLSQNCNQSRNEESSELVQSLKEKEKGLNETIGTLKHEEERLRGLNVEMANKLGHVEGDLLIKQTQIRRLQQQKRKLEEGLLLQKQKSMNSEIQIKRAKMELQIMEKEKQLQIQKMKIMSPTSLTHQSEINKLQEQIRLKDQRYQLLLGQMEQYKKTKPHDYPNPMKNIESREESHESEIKKEISLLKKQMVNFAEARQGSSMQALNNKIYLLERIVDEDNREKAKFLDEIRQINQDYQQLKRENKTLKEEVDSFERQERRMRSEISHLKSDIESSSHIRATLSANQFDKNALSNKIRELEEENKDLKNQYQLLKKQYRDRDELTDRKARDSQRKIDQLLFQIQKREKENEFNLDLAKAKSKADLQLVRNQENRAYKERDQWKREFDNMKKFYEQKMKQMRQQTDKILEEYAANFQKKQQQIHNLRSGADGNLENIRMKHDEEVRGLLARLESLTESNEKLAQQNSKYIRLESELYELRSHASRMTSMNETVNHLWQVKEAEYSNLNNLLKQMVP